MIYVRRSNKLYSTVVGSSSLKQTSSSTSRFSFPERFRGTIVERWKQYWESVAKDYYESTVGIGTYAKANPIKSLLVTVTTSCAYYCATTNPDERSYRSEIIDCSNNMLYISPSVRNPSAVQHLEYIEKCYNVGVVKRLNLLLFSVIWIDEFNDDIQAYKANCKYLKPSILSVHKRAIDIGFLNVWWGLKKIMVDYDVNPEEWKDYKELE
ncbi:mitochondrial import inner membrane translocase subunit Tim29 [Rhopalosiphum padi]|uniref:mitochondrial import inner membrane translocase subunit Tim29 n=1 Tax=Rhopalosiphum padi TaxID=40932 RepID=UPI00298EAD33|nr:mitochondrial import inner membrane translocase subunit Tim29 [Rhopalosiphum padi]